jgi:hypothetical protein
VIHAAYRVNAAAFYAAERRWPTSRFWQRRRGTYAATRAGVAHPRRCDITNARRIASVYLRGTAVDRTRRVP